MTVNFKILLSLINKYVKYMLSVEAFCLVVGKLDPKILNIVKKTGAAGARTLRLLLFVRHVRITLFTTNC